MLKVNEMTIEEEVIDARGEEATLGGRLNKIEDEMSISEEKLVNLYDASKVVTGMYYKEGVLITNENTDSLPLMDVNKGDKVYSSSLDFISRYATVPRGVRIGLFRGSQWVKDLTPLETAEQRYITIPDGVDKIAIAFFSDDTNRYVSVLKEDSFSTNLYDDSVIIKDCHYEEGVLKRDNVADTMPLMHVNTGEKIYSSSFNYIYMNSSIGGVRVGMFKDSVWVKDLTQEEVFQNEYIVIPEGVNQIAIPFWKGEKNRAIHRIEIINNVSNLYDENKVIKGLYFSEGKLISNFAADTVPLVNVMPGDKIYTSGIDFKTRYSSKVGVRIGFFRDNSWLFDLTQDEVCQKKYIEIPQGVTHISIPFWADDKNRTIYCYRSEGTAAQQMAVNAKIDQLQEEINSNGAGHLKHTKFSILGDNISSFKENISSEYPAIYPDPRILTDYNKTWFKKMIDKHMMYLLSNDSFKGSCIAGNNADTSEILQCMASQTRINNLGNSGTPDMILVYGGKNDADSDVQIGTFNQENPSAYTQEQIDALTVGTFADAYRTMLIRLMKTYPAARIVCILPNFTETWDTNARLKECCGIIKEACEFFGVQYIDMKKTGMTMFNVNTYLSDGKHPNELGMELLYKTIKKQL